MPKPKENSANVWEKTNGMHKMVANQIKLMLDQYKMMRGLYGGPNNAMMESVKAFWPQGTENYFKSFDIWLEQELQVFEKNLDGIINEYAKNIADLDFTAPNTDHYKMLVGEQSKLWLENYEKFKEQRDQMKRESLESAKKMFPAVIHPIIENTNKWFMDQNEKLELQILEQIRKYTLDLTSDDK
jgi:hypothetical protein